MRIRAKGIDGILDTSISKDALSETGDLVDNQLNKLSVNIMLDDLTDALYDIFEKCLFDDCENELFVYKHGELNLNHTHQITGVFEESAFLAGISTTTPTMPLTASTLPSISTSQLTKVQEKVTCSYSLGLCAEFGMSWQVTCVDKIIDDQLQVSFYVN